MSRIAHPAGRFVTRSFSLPADLNAQVDAILLSEVKGITEYIRSLIVADVKDRWQTRRHNASVALCALMTGEEWEAWWDTRSELEESTEQELALALEAAIAQRQGRQS